jgi:hypothetical protein
MRTLRPLPHPMEDSTPAPPSHPDATDMRGLRSAIDAPRRIAVASRPPGNGTGALKAAQCARFAPAAIPPNRFGAYLNACRLGCRSARRPPQPERDSRTTRRAQPCGDDPKGRLRRRGSRAPNGNEAPPPGLDASAGLC